jgi:uncharacterized protein DUF4326
MPLGAVSVTRPGLWGNPYSVEEYGREEAIRLFRHRLVVLCPDMAARARRELRGRDLACWCPIGQPCHADVLLEVANA